MKSAGTIILAVIVLLFSSFGSVSAMTMAFGYLSNRSKDANLDYLETIFPNSFANSLKNNFDINAIKPSGVEQRLQKVKLRLEKDYLPHEVPDILNTVGGDYFIYGNFTPLPDNRIKIVLHVYRKGSSTIFTFTSAGKLETEIFKLIDKITLSLYNFTGSENLYKTETIAPGSKLSIITNLNGEDLNLLYYFFMSGGYHLAPIQGNTLFNHVTKDILSTFTFITTKENAWVKISKAITAKFLHGPWAGKKYTEKINRIKKMVIAYDIDFSATKEKTLARLQAKHGNTLDYLLIIGFDGEKTAWLRCINMRTNDLVWMQNGITGSSIEDISFAIMQKMTMMPAFPVQK